MVQGSLVGNNSLLNPVHIVADLGIHTRIIWQGTAITPGDDALELSIADQRAIRVTLEGSNTVHGKGHVKESCAFSELDHCLFPLTWSISFSL